MVRGDGNKSEESISGARVAGDCEAWTKKLTRLIDQSTLFHSSSIVCPMGFAPRSRKSPPVLSMIDLI